MQYGHFRYYWLALLAGVTGHQMLLQFTLGWLLYKITGDVLDLAFLGMAIAIPALILNLAGGVLADRLEPKYLVAAAQATSATVVALLALLVMTDRVEMWHILVAAVIIGALQAFDQPSRSSVFPRLVEREHIVNAVAMESIVWNGVRILGPVLAGIVIERVSIEASMFISAATFYLMGAIIAVLRMRPRSPATGQVLRQVGDSLRYIRQHPIFFYVMLLTFCNSLFGMAYIGLMPEFAKEVLGVGAGKIGLLLGASGVGAILGTWIIGNLKHGFPKGKLILAGAFLYGIFQILFAVAASQQLYQVSMGLLFLVGIANSLYLVGGLSTLQELVPDQLRGRVMGLYGATWSLGPLGMAQGAFIADYLNAPWAVGIGAGILAVVAVLIFVFSPAVRSLRAGVIETPRPAYADSVAPDGE
jgi:MFS family permease